MCLCVCVFDPTMHSDKDQDAEMKTNTPLPSLKHTYTDCGGLCSAVMRGLMSSLVVCVCECVCVFVCVCVCLKGRMMTVIQVIKVNACQLDCLPFVRHPACLR